MAPIPLGDARCELSYSLPHERQNQLIMIKISKDKRSRVGNKLTTIKVDQLKSKISPNIASSTCVTKLHEIRLFQMSGWT